MNEPTGLPFSINGELPELDSPVLVAMLSGWIDASGAAVSAMDHVIIETKAETLIEFDADMFMDYRARRPVMELRNGVNTQIVWSVPHIKVGKDSNGQDVLLLAGPEPDSQWQLFTRTVAALAKEMNVSKMIGMGAYPFGAPHTRPVGLTSTSPDADIAERLSFTKSTMDVPAGVEAVLEHAMHKVGIPAMAIWAQVPHYVSTMAYPLASAALIDMVCLESGLSIDSSALRKESGVQRERLDQLVKNNPEHAEMLGKLEEAYDALHGVTGSITTDEAPIPTVDEIAAEVEQFLRDQQSGE